MTNEEFQAYIARVYRTFGHYTRHNPHVRHAGWGQYLDGPPNQGDKIGHYGTCAGLIIFSLHHAQPQGQDNSSWANPNILNYFSSKWSQKASDAKAHKHSVLTVRLALLLAALADPACDQLADIRKDVLNELIQGQIEIGPSTGGWGGWITKHEDRNQQFGSANATAFVVLALERYIRFQGDTPDRAAAEASLAKAQIYLKQHILSEGTHATPLLLGAYFRALPDKERTDKRVVKTSCEIMARERPGVSFDTHSFSFHNLTATDMERDYISVPRLFSYAVLVSASNLHANVGWGLRNLIANRAYYRTTMLMRGLQSEVPWRTNSEPYSATLDQLFLAWTAAMLLESQPRLAKIFRWAAPLYVRLSDNFLVRFIIPVLSVVLMAIFSKSPAAAMTICNWQTMIDCAPMGRLIASHSETLQIFALACGAFFAVPLASGVLKYTRDKLAVLGRK